ncbi:aminotransferase-like domain-containing protein [Leucobacter chinensis]|uniref:aminotransferase-like domain-containing protein n=1 Tax=Leucobacter chinensis TaxID=2851010 RepID=UPI001C24DA27
MSEVELVIQLDRQTPGSLSAKLVLALRHEIESGALRPGDRLPPTRDLAARLGVSRGTVVTAYEQLVAEGYFSSGQGLGTRVNERLTEIHHYVPPVAQSVPSARAAHPAHQQPKPIADLSARPAWRAAWRKAAVSERIGRPMPVEGDPELLYQVSEHLRAMRGTVRSTNDLLVTAGVREGLSLILTALGTTRGRSLVIGFEAEGPASLREVAERHGATAVSLPADDDGILVEGLPEAVLDAIIITPSFQFPGGGLMPLKRRLELLEWASKRGVMLIEDDFDSEQRYTRAPLPTFATLDDPERGVVATLGSFSATLSFTLAAGFLIVPASIRTMLLPVRRDLGCPVSPILQIALSELLGAGELRRHVARLRRARQRHEVTS